MNIEIKKCELNESINKITKLSKEWESENLTFGYCSNDKEDIIGNDLFIACLGDEIIGYLFGKCVVLDETITPIVKGDRCFVIEEIFVKKEYRCQGVGKAIFEYAENYYKKTIDYITLSTATKNYKSILHFYIDELDMSFWSAKLFKKIQ